jgi:hypothetical protein
MYERVSTFLTDPSFNWSVAFDLWTVALTDTAFSILDNEVDYTIVHISQCWAHYTGAVETFLNTSSLALIVDNLGGVISNQPAQHAASPPCIHSYHARDNNNSTFHFRCSLPSRLLY